MSGMLIGLAAGWLLTSLYYRIPTTQCPDPRCRKRVRDKPLLGTTHLCAPGKL